MPSHNLRFSKSLPNELSVQAVDSMLSVKQAAQFLHISPSHIYKLTHRRLIPHYKPMGKLVYFDLKDLKEFILKGRVASQQEIEQKAINTVCA